MLPLIGAKLQTSFSTCVASRVRPPPRPPTVVSTSGSPARSAMSRTESQAPLQPNPTALAA